MAIKEIIDNKLSLLFFSLVIFVDQISKYVWRDIQVHNPGIVLGTFSDVNPLLRVVLFSTFFILVLYIFIMIKLYFLNHDRFRTLTYMMAIFVGGIAGNSIDRIHLGFAIDFINVPLPFFRDYFFNLADVFQLLGFVGILYQFKKWGSQLFPEDTARTFKLLDSVYQFSFAFKFSFVAFFSSLMMATFAYVFLNVYMNPFGGKLENIFLMTVGTLTILQMLIAFSFGLLVSKRKIGPIFAFKRFINDLKEGRDGSLKLREKDSFKELEGLAQDINDLLKK